MNKKWIAILIVVAIIPYAIGQWIDNEPLVSKDLKLKPFWKVTRICPRCEN
jgi:hypothetical protein